MASSNSSANNRAILAELVKMLSLFPVPGQSDEGQKLRLAGYLEVISGFPSWVVQIACVKVCRGLYPQLNRAFAPTPAELAEIIRELLVKEGKPDADGVIKFDGEVPMTWVRADDPRWAVLCDVAKKANPKNRHYPMTSKHAPGRGSFFRTEYVDAVPLTDAERDAMKARPIRGVHCVVASVAAGMNALKASLRPEGPTQASQRERDVAALRERLAKYGAEHASLDAIPDGPARATGT
jgi:hypothetical protein